MGEELKSIREIVTFNDHGRSAREGFDYQDHIGVSLLLEMLNSEKIREVWFESIDDIDIIREGKNGKETVEFVQVKHEDRTSRYSVATITSRKKDRVGTSLFEKSLYSAQCKEEAYFRIITSFDVKEELKFLKLNRDSKKRNELTEKVESLEQKINSRCNNVSAPDNTGVGEWIKKCYWQVRPPKIDDLESSNIRTLHDVIEEKFPPPLLLQQLDDLYQKLLLIVKNASTIDLNDYPEKNKVTKKDLLKTIREYIKEMKEPKGLVKGLKEKIKKANLPDDYAKNAGKFREMYIKRRYEVDYMESDWLSDLEGEVMDKLMSLKGELDSGQIEGGLNFHQHCYKEVKKIATSERFINKDVPKYIIVGLMYQITNRCLHRFHKVEL